MSYAINIVVYDILLSVVRVPMIFLARMMLVEIDRIRRISICSTKRGYGICIVS